MAPFFLKCSALDEVGIGNLWQTTGTPSVEELKNLGLSLASANTDGFAFLKQVHSNRIHIIKHTDDAGKFNGLEGDGWIVLAQGIPVAIKTADCIPLYLFDKNVPVLALLHCGWRGIHKGIIENGIRTMLSLGAKTENTFAYLGPGIRRDDYIVGEEFRGIFPNSIFERDGKIFLDLFAEIERRLTFNDISNIKKFPLSTYSTKWLCSHRRDGKNAGRMIFSGWIK